LPEAVNGIVSTLEPAAEIVTPRFENVYAPMSLSMKPELLPMPVLKLPEQKDENQDRSPLVHAGRTASRPGLGKAELRDVWETITSGRRQEDGLPVDRLFRNDVVRHYEFAICRVPGLIEQWLELDVNNRGSVEREEFDLFFGDAGVWLESKLANFVGLEDAKEQLRHFYLDMRAENVARMASAADKEPLCTQLMVFKGNPGLPMVEVAQLLAELLCKMTMRSSATVAKVERDQLSSDSIESTESAINEVLTSSRDGVLFIENIRDFDAEDLALLLRAAALRGVPAIIAGAGAHELLDSNPSVRSKAMRVFEFADYTSREIAQLLVDKVELRGFKLAEALDVLQIARAVAQFTTRGQRAALNEDIAEHACRHAIYHLNRYRMESIKAIARAESRTAAAHLAAASMYEAPGKRTQLVPTVDMEAIEYGLTQVPMVVLQR
jgi:hypothetical protein